MLDGLGHTTDSTHSTAEKTHSTPQRGSFGITVICSLTGAVNCDRLRRTAMKAGNFNIQSCNTLAGRLYACLANEITPTYCAAFVNRAEAN
jgi:hypothetical protein